MPKECGGTRVQSSHTVTRALPGWHTAPARGWQSEAEPRSCSPLGHSCSMAGPIWAQPWCHSARLLHPCTAGTEPCLLTYLPKGHNLSVGWHCLAGLGGAMVEHAPLAGWLGTTGCAHPLLVSLLGPKGTCSDQALNSAGHGCGTNTGCIFSPCWGIPARLSWVQVAQSMAQPPAQPCSARRASLLPSPRPGMCPSQEGLPLHLPLGCGTGVSPGARVRVMPSSRAASLSCLLLLLRCLTRSGLTGRPQGHRLAPGWHHSRGHSQSWAPLPAHAQPGGTNAALFVEDEEEHHHE